MKLKLSEGNIRLEDKIIDLFGFEIRPKITDEDLEKHYDSFIESAIGIEDYFEDTSAFYKAINEASKDKRPKLIAKETRYPFLWIFRKSFMQSFLRPEEIRLNDEYFIVADYITKIPKTRSDDNQKQPDKKLREDIIDKFKRYPSYEGIIQIPDHLTQEQAKLNVFHESLHYLIIRYQTDTGKKFLDTRKAEEMTYIQRYREENKMHEFAVEILTNRLFKDEPEILFDKKCDINYLLYNELGNLISLGFLVGSLYSSILLPGAFISYFIKEYSLDIYKESRIREFSDLTNYPLFKI
jgi:hypothetical protein